MRGKHPPVSPPHSPLPSSKHKFYFTPPSTIRATPSNLSCTSHEVDLPPPLAFFPVPSSHEAFFLKCAVLIKLIPLPPEAYIDPLRANPTAVCGDLLRRAPATPSLHGTGEASIHLFLHSRTPSHLLIIISTLPLSLLPCYWGPVADPA